MTDIAKIAAGQVFVARQQSGCLPVFHPPCRHRLVVVGRWGHELARLSDCPHCRQIAAHLKEPTP